MIHLNDRVWVDPTQVTSIDIGEFSGIITVTLVNGKQYTKGADYGESVFATARKLVEEINNGRDKAKEL